MVEELAEDLSNAAPGVRIWLGGPEVVLPGGGAS